LDQFVVGWKKIVFSQRRGICPIEFLKLEILEQSRIFDRCPEENQKEFIGEFLVAVTCAVNLGAYGGRNTEFLAQFARQGFGERFSRFNFSAGEFPLQCVSVVTPPLADQEFRIPSDERCDDGWHKI
jgi:hypothetical protein